MVAGTERKPLSQGVTAATFPRPAPPPGRPRCPTHGQRMVYLPADDKMACPEPACRKVARKHRDFSDVLVGESKPAVYRGAIDVVFDSDGTPYLYLVDAHAMVDVSTVVAADSDVLAIATARQREPE